MARPRRLARDRYPARTPPWLSIDSLGGHAGNCGDAFVPGYRLEDIQRPLCYDRIDAVSNHPAGRLCATRRLSELPGRRPCISPDRRLSALDLALGFDWVHWFNFVAAHPRLDIALQVLYETSGIQIVGVLLWLGLKGYSSRLREIVALLVCTSLAMIVLSGLLPAESAWNYHGIGVERAYHFEDFSSLRAGTLRELPLGGMTGIVTFPSFHTAVAIVTVWVVRGLGGFWPLLVLNIGVLLSVPTAGGHYLTDMIAAAFITALLILIRSSGRQSNSGTHV